MKVNPFITKESCQPDFFRKGNKTEENVNEAVQKNLNFTGFEPSQKLIKELDKRNIDYDTGFSRDIMDRIRIRHKGKEWSVVFGYSSHGASTDRFEMVEMVNGHVKGEPRVYTIDEIIKKINQ